MAAAPQEASSVRFPKDVSVRRDDRAQRSRIYRPLRRRPKAASVVMVIHSADWNEAFGESV